MHFKAIIAPNSILARGAHSAPPGLPTGTWGSTSKGRGKDRKRGRKEEGRKRGKGEQRGMEGGGGKEFPQFTSVSTPLVHLLLYHCVVGDFIISVMLPAMFVVVVSSHCY